MKIDFQFFHYDSLKKDEEEINSLTNCTRYSQKEQVGWTFFIFISVKIFFPNRFSFRFNVEKKEAMSKMRLKTILIIEGKVLIELKSAENKLNHKNKNDQNSK